MTTSDADDPAVLRAIGEARAREEEFLYLASHDLRAPMRAIRDLTRWLAEDLTPIRDTLPADVSENLALLQVRAQRLEAMFDGLLAYSRAGRSWGPRRTVDVTDRVRGVWERLAPPRGYTLEVTGPGVRIETRPVALDAVLAALLDNAVRHHDRADGKIRVTFGRLTDFVDISVIDDGPGVPPDARQRVLRPFVRLVARDERDGAGLGLAVARRWVTAAGGTLALGDAAPRGTVARFTWPCAAPGTDETPGEEG